MNYSISIAIPTINRKEFLAECLMSVTRQTIKNMEIIVFDAGSNYNVQEVLDNCIVPIGSSLCLAPKNQADEGLNNFERIQCYHF